MNELPGYVAPLKRGFVFSQFFPSAYLPQQAKTGLAGDPGRAGLNNSALRAEAGRVATASLRGELHCAYARVPTLSQR